MQEFKPFKEDTHNKAIQAATEVYFHIGETPILCLDVSIRSRNLL